MKVVILCGGKGTRLREKTESIPKPLVEIGDYPILWHILKIYTAYGFDDFILCLGYKGQMIKEYFNSKNMALNPDSERWKITFVETGEETNTGGRIKKVGSFIKEESFMVTYGDGLADLNIKKLVEFHQAHGKIGTLTVVKPSLPFGLLEVQEDGRVSLFHEKPLLNQWVNGGFFIIRKKFLDYLGENDVLEETPLMRLAQEGQLIAFRHSSFWKCMDPYKDTVLLNELWASGKAPWRIW